MNGLRKFSRPMSDINVTPLVDVVLVLLIIFMVTAPMMQQGIDVNLPKATAKALPPREKQIVLTITRDKKIYIHRNRIPLRQLRSKLTAIYAERRNKEIFLRADRRVPYGFVIQAMAEIKRAGIEKVGMITEPVRARER